MKAPRSASPRKAPRKAPAKAPTKRPPKAPAGPVNADQIDRLRDRDKALAAASPGLGGPSLPGSTMELLESRTLSVKRLAMHIGAQAMPPEIAAMLMEGVRREGVSDASTLDEVLSGYIDEGTVDVYSVTDRKGGAADTWLRFTCGDTEVGYIFHAGALKAIVGDQDINPV